MRVMNACPRAARALFAIAFTAACTSIVACASAPAAVELDDPATLRAERDEWRGDRAGAVLLRHHVRATVGVASEPRDAESVISVHVVLTRYAPAGAPESPETLEVLGPDGAELTSVAARVLAPSVDGGARPVTPLATRDLGANGAVDPGQRAHALEFPALGPGEILELTAELRVPGTLTADARWLGHPTLPTAELLLGYDLPDHAVGALAVVGAPHRALDTTADGRRVLALFLKDLPPRGDGDAYAYARYVTVEARPRGFHQRFASTWRQATAGYVAGLVAPSEGLRQRYRAPFVPAQDDLRERAISAYLWVRDRLQRDDALDARWDAARPLVEPVATNDLTATDKVHALAWLLDSAEVPYRFAIARRAAWPPIDPERPAPGVFDVPLIRLDAHDLWLDPACRACEPGTVRPALRGGVALALPADGPPVALPTEAPPPPTATP